MGLLSWDGVLWHLAGNGWLAGVRLLRLLSIVLSIGVDGLEGRGRLDGVRLRCHLVLLLLGLGNGSGGGGDRQAGLVAETSSAVSSNHDGVDDERDDEHDPGLRVRVWNWGEKRKGKLV